MPPPDWYKQAGPSASADPPIPFIGEQMLTLHRLVQEKTGSRLQACQGCLFCDSHTSAEMDITISALVQMVIYNDFEVLTTRTLWSDAVLDGARKACTHGFNLHGAILALREEATRRGVTDGGGA